jgi:phosphatidylglycerophosphate synthase
MSTAPGARRPLATRSRHWPRALAGVLVQAGIRPNTVSLLAIAFAALAAAGLLLSTAGAPGSRVAWLVVAAAGIQLRLLCNLLDGLMAVEYGLGTPTGELFNDLPDRAADVLVLVAAGYAAGPGWAGILGWAVALLALLTAYIRVLGGALGLPQDFRGPMAKPHRMAVLTLACLAGAAEVLAGAQPSALLLALLLIGAGCVVTVVRRTRGLVRGLHAR